MRCACGAPGLTCCSSSECFSVNTRRRCALPGRIRLPLGMPGDSFTGSQPRSAGRKSNSSSSRFVSERNVFQRGCEHGVDRLAEAQLGEPLAGAKRERLERVRALAQLQQEVVLLAAHGARLLREIDLAREEHRRLVVRAERRQAVDLAHRLRRHLLEGELAVDEQLLLGMAGAVEHRARLRADRRARGRHGSGADLEPGRLLVPAVAQEVLRRRRRGPRARGSGRPCARCRARARRRGRSRPRAGPSSSVRRAATMPTTPWCQP
jgi:hypothetical protein